MTITAKFNSKCPICGKQIHAGSKVNWEPGQKAKCVSCTESAGTPAQSNNNTGLVITKHGLIYRAHYNGKFLDELDFTDTPQHFMREAVADWKKDLYKMIKKVS